MNLQEFTRATQVICAPRATWAGINPVSHWHFADFEVQLKEKVQLWFRTGISQSHRRKLLRERGLA